MGILTNLFSSKRKQIPILKATITFDDDNNTSIEFEKLHSGLVSPEYIRMVLHYYAKMLVNIDPNQPDSINAYDLLLTSIDSIVISDITENPNILKIADIDDVVRLAKPTGQYYSFIAILYSLSGLLRHISTEIPTNGTLQQVAFSVPILIHGVLQFLNANEIQILQRALTLMNERYRKSNDYNDLKTWESVPINAFLASIIASED